jgi:hypothetical protein
MLGPTPGTPRQRWGVAQLLSSFCCMYVWEGDYCGGQLHVTGRPGVARSAGERTKRARPPATALCTHAPEDGGREASRSWVVHFIAVRARELAQMRNGQNFPEGALAPVLARSVATATATCPHRLFCRLGLRLLRLVVPQAEPASPLPCGRRGRGSFACDSPRC